MQKTKETLRKLSKRGLLFWHVMVIHGPQNGPKMIIFHNALFLHFSWDFSDVIGRRSYPKRPKRRLFTGGPIPKALIMRWKRSQPEKHPVFCPIDLLSPLLVQEYCHSRVFFEFSQHPCTCVLVATLISHHCLVLHVSESKRASQLQSLTS